MFSQKLGAICHWNLPEQQQFCRQGITVMKIDQPSQCFTGTQEIKLLSTL